MIKWFTVNEWCIDLYRDSDGDFIDPIKAAQQNQADDDDPVSSLPAAPPKQKKAKGKKKGKAAQ